MCRKWYQWIRRISPRIWLLTWFISSVTRQAYVAGAEPLPVAIFNMLRTSNATDIDFNSMNDKNYCFITWIVAVCSHFFKLSVSRYVTGTRNHDGRQKYGVVLTADFYASQRWFRWLIIECLSNGFAALGEWRGPRASAHYYRYKINGLRILNFIDTSHFSLPPLHSH